MYLQIIMRQCTVKPTLICHAPEILLKKTDKFDPVYFLYPSLLRNSKAETVKMTTLFQTDNFCPQIKNPRAIREHKQKC